MAPTKAMGWAMRDIAAPVEGVAEAEAEPLAVPEAEALVARPVLVKVPVVVPVAVPAVPVRVATLVTVEDVSVLCLLVDAPVESPVWVPVWVPGRDPVGIRREEVPVVEASVEDPVVEEPAEEDPAETPEVEAAVEEEETVDDVPVEVTEEELSAASVTLNCWDWARMPVFFSEVESRLTWKPELYACQFDAHTARASRGHTPWRYP